MMEKTLEMNFYETESINSSQYVGSKLSEWELETFQCENVVSG
jgi:hypothetical protein